MTPITTNLTYAAKFLRSLHFDCKSLEGMLSEDERRSTLQSACSQEGLGDGRERRGQRKGKWGKGKGSWGRPDMTYC